MDAGAAAFLRLLGRLLLAFALGLGRGAADCSTAVHPIDDERALHRV